jgi:hypothetical protein
MMTGRSEVRRVKAEFSIRTVNHRVSEMDGATLPICLHQRTELAVRQVEKNRRYAHDEGY